MEILFLISYFRGDIVLWDLDRSGKQKWMTLGQDSSEVHNRPVFSILPVGTNHFLTSSMDRQVKGLALENLTAMGNAKRHFIKAIHCLQ